MSMHQQRRVYTMVAIDSQLIALNQDIVGLVSPLTSIGIDYFIYERFYQDGSRFHLLNNWPWLEHYYQAGYSRCEDYSNYANESVLISSLSAVPTLKHSQPEGEIFSVVKNHFNMDHFLAFSKHYQDCLEICFFEVESKKVG